jgi:hypothetical protein
LISSHVTVPPADTAARYVGLARWHWHSWPTARNPDRPRELYPRVRADEPTYALRWVRKNPTNAAAPAAPRKRSVRESTSCSVRDSPWK